MIRTSPHPALRVPLPGGGPISGEWTTVRWSADGIPILIADVEEYLDHVGDDLDAPLDALGHERLSTLATYLPHLLAPGAPLRRALRDVLRRRVPARVDLAVELGCSVGADLRTLASVAREVIGVDSSLVSLRAARAQLAGEVVPLLSRVEGRSFRSEDPVVLPPIDNVWLAVGNALDPPLFPGVANIAVAMNVLDSVSAPLDLIGQMDAILAPGGLLVLSSPFAWKDDVTPPARALGGGLDPRWVELGTPDGLVELLAGRMPELPYLRYEILERMDVPWSVRTHARQVTTFDVHLVAARKVG